VERVWRDYKGCRISLHCIHPCESSEALFHPHPWPSAMEIYDGIYEMRLGSGPGDVAPPVAATLLLSQGSQYEMVHPDGWHSVRPLGRPSMSLMVSGPPWDRTSPRSPYPLKGLPADRRKYILDFFSKTISPLKIEFGTVGARDHFARWLCGSGEQDYWQWMECREQEEEGPITATEFQYFREGSGFVADGVIRTNCGRFSKGFPVKGPPCGRCKGTRTFVTGECYRCLTCGKMDVLPQDFGGTQ
jgi:hypothetical protein